MKPDGKVLDVGSGIGRKTIPLVDYLTADGLYEGVDIVRSGVDWCRKKISVHYPYFRFHYVDVYSKFYNPRGKILPSEFRFPFKEAEFDFVVLCSVFTHMTQPDMEHYFDEISRVMKKGGRCLISYLLLNEESLALGTQKWTWRLVPQGDGSMVLDESNPEDLIAHPQDLVLDQFRRVGLRIMNVFPGSWCGRSHYLSFQDLILAERM